MAIDQLSEAKMGEFLGELFTPARAIRSPEFLKGREANLREINRAFASKGRHVFIYGDRGVGKTSLALTSAHLHQSSDGAPITVSCDSDATLFELVEDIGNQAISCNPMQVETLTKSLTFNFKFISSNKQSSIMKGQMPKIETINECVDIIRMLTEFHSKEPIIVIDEFDRVKTKKIRRQFAEFLKKVSDSDLSARIIICGIARSLDELVDEHLSVARNLASIELPRLSHDGRWAIIDEACTKLNVKISKNMLVRIGQISDGFPHYIHLVGEKIFWAAFDDETVVESIAKRHFDRGISAAVTEAEALPRLAYRQATEKYTDDYKEVLWAISDGPHLRRQTSDMYKKSYIPMMKKRDGREMLDKAKFSNRLNRLKTTSHGEIIKAFGGGWFEYTDNIVRGYVRLRAQREGIEVGDGYFNAHLD